MELGAHVYAWLRFHYLLIFWWDWVGHHAPSCALAMEFFLGKFNKLVEIIIWIDKLRWNGWKWDRHLCWLILLINWQIHVMREHSGPALITGNNLFRVWWASLKARNSRNCMPIIISLRNECLILFFLIALGRYSVNLIIDLFALAIILYNTKVLHSFFHMYLCCDGVWMVLDLNQIVAPDHEPAAVGGILQVYKRFYFFDSWQRFYRVDFWGMRADLQQLDCFFAWTVCVVL